MIDIESAIFDPVATAFSAAYPHGARYSEPVETSVAFPTLILYQEDRADSGYINLDSNKIVLCVEAYSDLTSGAKQQCKEIIALVEETLFAMGPWELVFCNPLKNADERIYRIRARYRCVAVREPDVDGNISVRLYHH